MRRRSRQWQRLIDAGLAGHYLLPKALAHDDQPVLLEPGALVAHEHDPATHYESVFAGSRLLGANRVRADEWGLLRRTAYADAVPIAMPPLQLWRLARSLRDRPELWWPALIGLPIIFASHQAASIGEALGYLFGPGDATAVFDQHYLHSTKAMGPALAE